ncbi:MAG: oligosaccharide flippase family protein [Hyphomonadaceae bacterium]|nr:oligosaccharide flippase family protein [Hyphomonadaceae bacterium]
MTGAELVSRVGRVFAAIVLARQLDATAFGVAAIALTVFEITRVFTENGIGAAVIRATSRGFDRVANTAHRLMWIVCLGLFVVQVGAGVVVETLLPGRDAGLMVASLGLVFLMMPCGVMHAYCLQRDERMKALAAIMTAQVAADHVLTAALAIAGFGAWAIVLPKILTTPIWLIGMLRTRAWTRNRAGGYSDTTSILKFSLPVLGSELMRACRDQLDKVIISLTLGVEALGLYYFAFNAGLGVSTALNRAFSNAVYPHLCAARDQVGAFRKSILHLGLPFGAMYCMQAALALIYVPIVFGPTWASAAPLVAILCLGGPARLFIDTVRMKARARGQSGQDFQISFGLSTFVLIPFALFASHGLFIVSALSVAAASIFALIATVIALSERQLSPSTNLGVNP